MLQQTHENVLADDLRFTPAANISAIQSMPVAYHGFFWRPGQVMTMADLKNYTLKNHNYLLTFPIFSPVVYKIAQHRFFYFNKRHSVVLLIVQN